MGINPIDESQGSQRAIEATNFPQDCGGIGQMYIFCNNKIYKICFSKVHSSFFMVGVLPNLKACLCVRQNEFFLDLENFMENVCEKILVNFFYILQSRNSSHIENFLHVIFSNKGRKTTEKKFFF